MSESRKKNLTFKTKAASKKYGAAYRRQFDLGLDGEPRRRGKKGKKR